MKKVLILFVFISAQVAAYACPVCERNKAAYLRGISHGSSPQSNWDYVIVIAMIIIAIATLFYSVKWLIRPNEKNKSHIKYSFLTEQ